MTLVVVDASVAFKWFVEEPGADAASKLRSAEYQLCAPEILPIELAHGLRRRVLRGIADRGEARAAVSVLGKLPVVLVPSGNLLGDAFELAISHHRGVYDALYVVLAARLGCQLVTADRKLHAAVVGAFPQTVVLLSDFSAA